MHQSCSPRLGKFVHTILSKDFSHSTQTPKALVSKSIPDHVGVWHGLIPAYKEGEVHLCATDMARTCVTFWAW